MHWGDVYCLLPAVRLADLGRLGRNRFPSVRAFLHLRIVAFRFPAIMPIAGLCPSDGLSGVLLLNIHRRWSGLENHGRIQRRIIGGSRVVIAGWIIGRAVTECFKAWTSETSDAKTSKTETGAEA